MRCPSCGSPAVFRDSFRGEEVCTRCGLVILERIASPDAEFYRIGEKACFDPVIGEDPRIHDKGLGSDFWVGDVSPSTRAKLRRMKRMQRRARVEERTLVSGILEISDACRLLGLPYEVRRTASVLYRKARARGITRGRNRTMLSLSLCYLACRAHGILLREREILQCALLKGMDEKRARKQFRQLCGLLSREMGIKATFGPMDYVDKFSSQLGLPLEVRMKAREVCSRPPPGVSPHVWACAAIYLAAKSTNHKITLHSLSSKLGVGITSIWRALGKLDALSGDDDVADLPRQAEEMKPSR